MPGFVLRSLSFPFAQTLRTRRAEYSAISKSKNFSSIRHTMRRSILTSVSLSMCALGLQVTQAAHPSRGLWVGEVALNAVNEATGAVGDSNTYEFTDPEITTPTSDTAYLRLILHVNGAGQVQLLKSVAVAPVGTDADGNPEIVLITDPELYSSYSGIATRVASAFYDFGDSHAVAALQTIIDTAVDNAVTNALDGDSESASAGAIQLLMDDLVADADVSVAYLDRSSSPTSFLTDNFLSLTEAYDLADQIAEAIHIGTLTAADFEFEDGASSYDPLGLGSGFFIDVVDAAIDLRDDNRIYNDTRGIDAVVNLMLGTAEGVEALDAALSLTEKQAYARVFAESQWQNAGDTEQNFNRFLASAAFSDLPAAIIDPTVQAALDADTAGNDVAMEVQDAIGGVDEFLAANVAAQVVYSSAWDTSAPDRRGEWAVNAVVEAAKESAAAQVALDRDVVTLTAVVEQAIAAAVNGIIPGAIFGTAPSEDYSEFVTGSEFSDAAATAASTAANEASFQLGEGVLDAADLRVLTERAVENALGAIMNTAAALPKYEITLNGSLESGGVVIGEFFLPGLAPTNPFLHRLHPDHRSGFEITRRIQLVVDGESSLSSYGVSSFTGTYEEEIFGLHKPLGPNQDIGLKTSGSFKLNRLTLVDSLNF